MSDTPLYLQLINEEKEKQTGYLDLGRCGLTEIPQEVFECVWLETLILSNRWRGHKNRKWVKSKNKGKYNLLKGILLDEFQKLEKLHTLKLNGSGTIYNEPFHAVFKDNWQVKNTFNLPKLKHLQYLDLSHNQVSDISFLAKLTKLQALDLSYNQVVGIRSLQKLKNLQYLDISYNRMTGISILQKLTNLQTLDLSYNKITLIHSLQNLTNLHALDLSYNEIANFSFLQKLTNLQTLELRSNKITDFNFLQKLTNLQALDLRDNKITNISFLQKLINLQTLELSYNQISDIHFLQKLTNLQALDLRENKITNISFLQRLTNLQVLELRNNNITDISFLQKLTNLQALDLRENKITDISFLQKLTNLQALDLRHNQVSDISSLLPLILSGKMQVTLKGYRSGLLLYSNPIETPPLEVVAKGNKAIIKYYKELEEQGKDHLYEAKMLIVGQGGTGKTTLAWKIKDINSDMPEEGNDRTKGIDIQALPIRNIHVDDKDFRMNVWDFGGQGYYHSTHQFFLTKRSLYVLLNNTRLNNTDFNYWLQTIRLFSDNSPVIIVQNQVGGAPNETDLYGLRKHFTEIIDQKEVDLANITDGRVARLIKKIEIEVQQLPHVGTPLPKKWVTIRKEINILAKEQAHIDIKVFRQLCQKHQVKDKADIKLLSSLFHDLGIFLHFHDDPVLSRLVILQNAWATKGVYQILDNDLIRNQNGYFTAEQAETIWENTVFEEMHHELLQLMEKFKLCYRIPYDESRAYISPQLLPKERPKYNWDKHQNLIIYYEYEFMPQGILSSLIVNLHQYIKDIKGMAWRSGCVFTYQNTDAQIIETYGNRKLEIRLNGKNCVRLSSIIIRAIDEYNTSFKRIEVAKKLPCNCSRCRNSDKPYFYTYKNLLYRKEHRRQQIECDLSFEKVNIQEVLEGVYLESAAKQPSIKQLIARDRLKEAIDVFELTHPDDAILLLSQYHAGKRLHLRKLSTDEQWEVIKNKIAHSLLELSKSTNKTTYQRVFRKEQSNIKSSLEEITNKLTDQDILLNKIFDQSQHQQQELIQLFQNIEEKEIEISDQFAADIVSIVTKGMQDFETKIPNAKGIIKEWKAAQQELKLAPDVKSKLKWSIPFLFVKYEKEIAWNGKDWFRAIRNDIQKGRKGDWSEMFVK